MSEGEVKQGQGQLGFGWWTFSGWASLVVGTLICLGQWKDLGGFAFVLAAINVGLSVMIIRFSKTAFVIATVLSINPIIWIINGIYLKNRWNDPRVLENKGREARADAPENVQQVRSVEGRNEPWVSTPVAATEPVMAGDKQSQAPAQELAGLAVRSEEDMWAAAMAEESSGNRRQGLWAKCFGESGGVESAAKAAYMAARVEEMKSEARAAIKAAEDRRRAEEEERRLAHLNEEQRAYERLPKGECPNCDAVIPVSSVECPKCEANFGPGSAWKVRPAT